MSNSTTRSRKLLFFAMNGTGIGHLMRLLGIAEMLRTMRPELQILFISEVSDSRFLRLHHFPFIQIPSLHSVNKSEDWSGLREQAFKCYLDTITSTVGSFQPDIVVYDTYVHPDVADIMKEAKAKEVFVMRERSDTEAFFKEFAAVFRGIGLIVFVQERKRVALENIPHAIRTKTYCSGPVIRRDVSDILVEAVRRKYNISSQQIMITITNGGGTSHQEETDPFIATVLEAVADIDAKMSPYRLVVFPGPLFKNSYQEIKLRNGTMSLRDYEPFLIDVMAASQLVISRGGWNTLQEILAVGVPAICVPAPRKYEDQGAHIRNISETHPKVQLGELNAQALALQILRVMQRPAWHFKQPRRDICRENKIRLAEKVLALL